MDEEERGKLGDKEIIVNGILGIEKDVLELFFENSKRSGGSNIECIEIDEENDKAIITYSELGVVEHVLKKGPTFKIGSQKVTVERPPKPDPRTVIVEGIPEDMPLEMLELFFENRKKSSGGDIHQIQYEEGSGVALITFQNVEVAQRVLCREDISLSNIQLRISPVTSKHLNMKASSSIANSTTTVPDPRVIYVAGIPADIDEEKLKLILESKKYGNIEIESMDLNNESGSAVITCRRKEDADKVLEKGVLQVSGAELSFSSGKELEVHSTSQPSSANNSTHSQQGVCTIKITNLPKISETYLTLTLEKIGAKLSCITMYPEDSTAIVRFDQLKGTSCLLREKYLLLEGIKCPVIPLYTRVHDDCEGSVAIKVSGLNDAVTDEMLEMYFNNRRKSGGYNVQSVLRNLKGKKAVITFKCVDAVRNVLGMQQKQKLTLKGSELSVEMFHPLPPPRLADEPTEHDKLIMIEAPPVSKEDVEAFLCCQNQHGNPGSKDISIDKMLYSWTSDRIFIVFSDKIDYSAMLEICVTMPLKDKMVSLIKVSLPTMIQVRAPEPLEEEDLELYFESRKSGADGAIVSTTFFEQGRCAVIDYGNNSVVRSVLQKTHKVAGIAVKVDPFYPDFGICPYHYDPSQPWSVVPDSFKYILEDQYIGKYLMQKPSVWKLLCDLGRKNGFGINKEKSTETELCICYKDNNDESPPDQVIWQETCKEKLDGFLKAILRRSFTMINEMYEIVLQVVKEITLEKDNVLLDFSKEKSLIVITGWVPYVRSLEDQIKKCIQTLEEKLLRHKNSLEEKMELKQNVIIIMKTKRLNQMLNQKFPTVQVKFVQGGLSLSGLPCEITRVKLFIYENIVQQIKHRHWKCSEIRRSFIKKKVIHSFLISELKKAKTVVVWNIKGSEVILSAMTEQELQAGQKILEEAIVEHVIGFKKENLAVINSPVWGVLKQKLTDGFGEMFIIKEDVPNQRIHLMATRDRFVTVLEEINNCFDVNSILTAKVDAVKPVVELITKFHLDKINAIRNNFKKHSIHIQQHNQGFLVQGTKFILQSVVQALHKLCAGVVSKDHEISCRGMERFFHSEKGREAISALETIHKVICVDLKDVEPITVKHPSGNMENRSGIFYTCIISGERTVKVLHGDLTKQKVDVIVNVANDRLHHIAGLAAAIVNAGGRVIQEECSSYIKHKGVLLAGEVFTSSAGHLPCKLVVHAVAPRWKGGHMGETNELYEAISASLEKTEEASMKSIAIPAVSSGIYGFPLSKATDIICEAVKDHFVNNVSSKITEVCLIDNQIEGAKSFVSSAKNCFSLGRRDLAMQGQVASRKPYTKIPDQSMLISVKPDTLRTKEGISITFKKGSLPDEQADALLNSTQKNLDLGAGGLSAVLIKAAGPVIQQECDIKKPSSLNPGDIIVTSGGKLNVKSIFHGFCSPWSKHSDEKDLRMLLSNALGEADRCNYVSLAIPAVGTGYLKYPPHIVTKVIVDEVVSFSQQHPQTTLKDVRIVLFPGDSETIQAFDHFWKSAVQQQSKKERRKEKLETETKKTTESWNSSSNVEYTILEDKPSGLIAKVGVITFRVIKSDITKVHVDAIVNSTDSQFSDKGAVAKAIFDAGGEELKKECKAIWTTPGQFTDVVITNGGKLNCRKVIHVNVTSPSYSLKELLFRAFQLAEKSGMRRLAIPALGTGMLQKSTKEISHNILKAIMEFAVSQNPIKLQEVYLVLCDKSSFEDFQQHLTYALSGKEAGWLPYLKDFPPLSNPFTTEGSNVRPVLTYRIYAIDMKEINLVTKKLDEIGNSVSNRHIFDKEDEQEAIAKMSVEQEQELKNIAKKHHLSISIHKGIRMKRIVVEGYSDTFVTCVSEIAKVITKVQLDEEI